MGVRLFSLLVAFAATAVRGDSHLGKHGYPHPDTCDGGVYLFHYASENCVGTIDRHRDRSNIEGEMMALQKQCTTGINQYITFPNIPEANKEGNFDWSPAFDLISVEARVQRAGEEERRLVPHPSGGQASSDGVGLVWYTELSTPNLRTQFQWKLHVDNDGTFVMRSAAYRERCIWPKDGKTAGGSQFEFATAACSSQHAKLTANCVNVNPDFTSTTVTATTTTTTTTTESTTTVTTNTILTALASQMKDQMTAVDNLMEAQILKTDTTVATLRGEMDELKETNAKQAAQIDKLVGMLASVGTAGGVAVPPTKPTCDTGASVWDAPAVVGDGKGSLDVQACFGTITLSSAECTVEPCALAARLAVVEEKLAQIV